MATVESLPYRTPSPSTVTAMVTLIEPDVELSDLTSAWVPGSDLRFGIRLAISNDFYEQSALSPEADEIAAYVVATCLASRTSWREKLAIRSYSGGGTVADGLVILDGELLADEVSLDVWVVGPGLLPTLAGSASGRHEAAKLWRMSPPLTLSLEDTSAGFPTSAVSFQATYRRDTPWAVESPQDAGPEWSISSAVRLFINTDSPLCESLLSGEADSTLFQSMQVDIHLVVLHRLASWRDTISADQMIQIATADDGCLAALGVAIAGSMGLELADGMRMVTEDLAELLTRSREQVTFGRL
ncbi:hypothetical protein [Microbacterium sp. NC79]|uniref:hypothetical protein n=1 Tax=Microbacterium sp. NC79 TaxID=2851009 RepID=UPI001C2C5BE6|nr:hypothetical protein [Microbacterium sp. NC79]MBV0895968.1 hypothetical protein [Microbacterium sp. NC79]